MMLGIYCQQGARTERTDKEFTTRVVDVDYAVVRNALADILAASGDSVMQYSMPGRAGGSVRL